jgi:hypothetical protein
MRKLGIIKLKEDLILKWLDYTDATIKGVSFDIEHDTVDILLESQEMPEVKEGDIITVVTPTYITYTDAMGHNVTLRDKK